MKSVCATNQCCGCMACINVCTKSAINIEDSMDAYNAVIDEKKCASCGRCVNVCPNNNLVTLSLPIKWIQGWCNDKSIRENSTSGGIATGISKRFIENEGIVVSCLFSNGEFIFEPCYDIEELNKYCGSKYVKSNPNNAYKAIDKLLQQGRKVLFIGLPCQVAGLKNYIPEKLLPQLYTIDLICHGTPSPLLLNNYLNSLGYNIEDIENIKFRIKSDFRASDGYTPVYRKEILDPYTFSFLNGINYTDNCYQCRYAGIKRVSDLTIGDSWGSKISESEKRLGISLMLCQNRKGLQLLEMADLHLENVDIDNAVKHNSQLQHPVYMPKSRKYFFSSLKNGNKYAKSIFQAEPMVGIRQLIKKVLVSLKLWGGVQSYTIAIKKKNEQSY